ncbi:hypothetical protein ADP8_05227 (plasmid) [Roseomonas mucosa]|nr:hypothetical protein ADP8_05227 [Roseomonas mucosa]
MASSRFAGFGEGGHRLRLTRYGTKVGLLCCTAIGEALGRDAMIRLQAEFMHIFIPDGY